MVGSQELHSSAPDLHIVFKHFRGIKGICPGRSTSKYEHFHALLFIPVSRGDPQTVYETVHQLFYKYFMMEMV